MIPFLLYSLIFLFLIYRNGFFGICIDSHINKRTFTILFFGKILAVPVFYLAYQHFYGGIQNFDTGKFYNDVTVITGYAKSNPLFYLKLLFGLQNDAPGSGDFEQCLRYTLNWDNGNLKDYLYNDNRVVIRIHSLFDFFAFGSYFVHALFNCFLSFTGIVYLYKSFKTYFERKELWVLLILCFFPALWFYTGALLKEGICLFVMGCSAFQIKQISEGSREKSRIIFLTTLVLLSLFLKPYLLMFFILCMTLFFLISNSTRVKRKSLVFLSTIFALIVMVNFASLVLKNKSLTSAALDHQRQFADMSRGGIFLKDSSHFIRLEYDSSLILSVQGKKNVFRIRPNVAFTYWELSHVQDTMYERANKDSTSEYLFVYQVPKSGSNIVPGKIGNLQVWPPVSALYYSLFHPLFFNARNALQTLASVENMLIIAALLVVFIGYLQNKKDSFMPSAFLVFAFILFIVIGTTAPNSGAIFRYRSPVVIFVLLSALYYLDFGFKKLENTR